MFITIALKKSIKICLHIKQIALECKQEYVSVNIKHLQGLKLFFNCISLYKSMSIKKKIKLRSPLLQFQIFVSRI